jgi:pyruvate,orthophosphate dikinase
MAEKYVYFFGNGKAEGRTDMKNLLGGKGANLAEMTNIGVPVPAGFTITTDVCTEYNKLGQQWPADLNPQVDACIKNVEEAMGFKFGDKDNPLLLSVRSGARVSMPGMMDTVLNLGLNDETVLGLQKQGGDLRFAYDSYRRFIQMYGDVVMGCEHHDFETLLQAKKDAAGVKNDTELTADNLKELVGEYKALVKEKTGKDFPNDPKEQLVGAVNAVFNSWNTPRAITYRRINHIPGEWGTAVNVQSMVYGNMGEGSATGVAFTRDPSTGEKRFYGEYLINAQGEDVVAGIRTPQPITVAQKESMKSDLPAMENELPELYKELVSIYEKLEKHYRDMQDLEFTIQQGKLYLLQTRTGKRTGAAAIRIAVEMESEGLIDKDEAVLRVGPEQLDQLLHPMIDPSADVDEIAKGLPASPGAVSGQIVFTAEEAVEWAEAGKQTILVRLETSPEDISGMNAANGILTARGGMTSHAAVVGRGMGKTCVVGCGALSINHRDNTMSVGDRVFKEGDWITLDGTSGQVMAGQVPTVAPKMDDNYKKLMGWADEARTLGVWTNADAPEDAQKAREFGAQGIGLCLT